jgi:hypothetical protein
MPVEYVQLSEGFSTADADLPSLTFDGGTLVFRFSDWQERLITIHFADAVAFRWQVEAQLPPDIRDDASYEVINSPWVAELAELGAAPAESHHYKLCLNAVGVLDVIASKLTLAP